MAHQDSRQGAASPLAFALLDAVKASELQSGIRLQAVPEADRVRVTVSGATDRNSLQNALGALTPIVSERLALWMAKGIAQRIRVSEMRITELEKGRDRLFEHLGAIGASDLQNSLVPSLAGELADLETQVVQEQVRLETLHEVAPEDLFTLEEIQRSSVSRLGPSHRLTVAIAAVLGICAGVLLTFLVQSLATVRERAKSDVKC